MSTTQIWIVTWQENHPDKDNGVKGAYRTEEEADAAIASFEVKDKELAASRGRPTLLLNWYTSTPTYLKDEEDGTVT